MSRLPEQLTATEPDPPSAFVSADRRDHRSIRALVRAAYGQYAPSVPAPVFRRYLADLLDLDRHAANGELLVAEHDHRVVGYAAFYPDAGRLGFNFPNGMGQRSRARRTPRRAWSRCRPRPDRGVRAPGPRRASAGLRVPHRGLHGHRDRALRRTRLPARPEYDVDLALHYGFHGLDPIPVIAYRRELVPGTSRHLPGAFRARHRRSAADKSTGSPAEGARSSVVSTQKQTTRRLPCTTRCSPSRSPRPASTT